MSIESILLYSLSIIGLISTVSCIGLFACGTISDVYNVVFKKNEQAKRLIKETIEEFKRLNYEQEKKNDKEIVLLTLEEFGLSELKTECKNLLAYFRSGYEIKYNSLVLMSKKLDEIVQRHIKFREDLAIGSETSQHLQYYIDLRSTLLDMGNVEEIGELFYSYICFLCVDFDFIAVHRNSSVILAYYLSTAFHKPILFISNSPKITLNKKFVYIEASVSLDECKGKKALIIDDSTSGGGLLKEVAIRLKEERIIVNDICILYARTDSSFERRDKLKGYTVHLIKSYSDAELDALFRNESLINHSFSDKIKRINLYLTTKCNFSCKYCCIKPWKEKINDEVEPNIFKEYLSVVYNSNSNIEQIMLLGGEPTLYNGLDEICRYIKDELKIKSLSICTNGSNSDAIIRNKKYLDYLTISIDSTQQDLYQEMRAGGNFANVIKNLELFIKEGFNVIIAYTVTNINYKMTINDLKFFEKMGVYEVNIHIVSKTGGAKECNDISVDADKWVELTTEIEKQKFLMRVKYPIKYSKEESEKKLNCMLKKPDRLNIMPDGTVYSCCLFIDTNQNIGSLGNGRFELNEHTNEYEIARKSTSHSCPADIYLTKSKSYNTMCIHDKNIINDNYVNK